MTKVRGAETFRTSAEAYDRHIGRYGSALAALLISAVGIKPGQRALDVGCGLGALTAALAELLGPEQVAAVDPSEPFAAACASRVEGVRVEVAAAEALPFPDATFDAALSQLVVNFMTDAPAGVGEMRRVTRPGGAVAAAVWDYTDGMTLLRRFWDAAVALDPAAASLDEGRSMPYCQPDELERLWEQAGLEAVSTSELLVEAEYSGFDDLWQPLESGVGPSGAYVTALAPERRMRLREELRARLDVGAGPFRLSARAWCVLGRVPDAGPGAGGAPEPGRVYELVGPGPTNSKVEVDGGGRLGRSLPGVEDVRGALLVAGAVGALALEESVALVEALRSRVRDEGPQPEAGRPLALGHRHQRAADSSACAARLHVELVEPVSVQHQDAGQAPRLVLGGPQLALLGDVAGEPPAHLVSVCAGGRDRRDRRPARPEPQLGGGRGVVTSPSPDPHRACHKGGARCVMGVDASEKEPNMHAPRAEPSPSDIADEINSLSAGLGILTTALFPFALPALLLALPLAIPLIPLALVAVLVVLLVHIVALPLRLAREVVRRVRSPQPGHRTTSVPC